MQPEQQNSNQLPYQAPDYLHLEPIVDPSVVARKKRKKNLIILAVLTAIILTAATLIFVVWQLGSSEREFYRALDNLMQTSYLDRNFTLTPSDKSTLTAQSRSDCSTPKSCKSTTDYSINQSSNGATNKITAQEIVTSNDSYFLRFTATPASYSASGLGLDQWHQFTGQDGIHELLLTNTYQGFLLNGNFNQPIRQQLIDFIKTNRIYTIQSSSQDLVNNVKSTMYTVQTSVKLLQRLGAEASKLLNDKSPAKDIKGGDISQMKIWVNNDTNKIEKIDIHQNRDQDSTDTEIMFGYPPSVKIQEPSI